jgi:hypothetical protein
VERRRQNANIDNFAVVERPADRCGSYIAPVALCDVAMTEESFSVPVARTAFLGAAKQRQQIDEIAGWMELNWGYKPHFSCFGWGWLTD